MNRVLLATGATLSYFLFLEYLSRKLFKDEATSFSDIYTKDCIKSGCNHNNVKQNFNEDNVSDLCAGECTCANGSCYPYLKDCCYQPSCDCLKSRRCGTEMCGWWEPCVPACRPSRHGNRRRCRVDEGSAESSLQEQAYDYGLNKHADYLKSSSACSKRNTQSRIPDDFSDMLGDFKSSKRRLPTPTTSDTQPNRPRDDRLSSAEILTTKNTESRTKNKDNQNETRCKLSNLDCNAVCNNARSQDNVSALKSGVKRLKEDEIEERSKSSPLRMLRSKNEKDDDEEEDAKCGFWNRLLKYLILPLLGILISLLTFFLLQDYFHKEETSDCVVFC